MKTPSNPPPTLGGDEAATSSPSLLPCDPEIFKKGQSLAALDARSDDAEAWVLRVAAQSNQRVDWHYSGGRAHILVLGDHAVALAAAKELAPTLKGRVLCWFEADAQGLYRADVTPVPPGTVAVDPVFGPLVEAPEQARPSNPPSPESSLAAFKDEVARELSAALALLPSDGAITDPATDPRDLVEVLDAVREAIQSAQRVVQAFEVRHG